MNPNNTNQVDRDNYTSPPVRQRLRFAIMAVLLAGLGGVFIHFRQHVAESGRQDLELNGRKSDVISPKSEDRNQRSEVRGQPEATAANPSKTSEQPKASSVAVALSEPTPESRQLVRSLSLLDQAGRPMTVEQATEWKQNLQQLVQQGRDSVPAITEFLKQNKDVNFDASLSDTFGYTSVRRGMIDALSQIGGPEAVSGTL